MRDKSRSQIENLRRTIRIETRLACILPAIKKGGGAPAGVKLNKGNVTPSFFCYYVESGGLDGFVRGAISNCIDC